jgi:hypothetical protein
MDEKKKTVNKAASRKRMFILNYLMSYIPPPQQKRLDFLKRLHIPKVIDC